MTSYNEMQSFRYACNDLQIYACVVCMYYVDKPKVKYSCSLELNRHCLLSFLAGLYVTILHIGDEDYGI